MGYQGTCTNCKEPLGDTTRVFQGVIICDTCFKIVSHTIERAKKELQMVFLTYTDTLRVALVKGELRPPVMPETEVTREQFFGAVAQVGARHAQFKAKGRSKLRPLRDASQHPAGQAPGGSGNPAVPGRGEVREVSEVQEGGADDSRGPEGNADATNGVAEPAGGIDG